MVQALRDSSQVTSALGSYNGTPVTLKVEHATGYLKAVITNTTLSAPTHEPTLAEHDDNGVRTALGSYNGLPKALLIQNSSGKLRAIIV